MKVGNVFIKIGETDNEHLLEITNIGELQSKHVKQFDEFLRTSLVQSGAKGCKSCRAGKMLKNDYSVAKIAFDTSGDEPLKVCQKFEESLRV